MRKLRLAAAVSLALATPGVFALGLGDIEMRSALNQPMNAEIRLTSVQPGELEGMIVKLASREAFEQAGIERTQVLTGLRFAVDESGAEPVIRVTSVRPVVEPFLNFLIEVDSPQARMVREYTVLLDPPVFMTPSASGSSALDGTAAAGARDEVALVAPAPIERDATIAGTDDLLMERGNDDTRSESAGESVSLDGLLGESPAPGGDAVALSDLEQPNTRAQAQNEARSQAAGQADGAFDFDVELIGDTSEVTDGSESAADEAAGDVVSLDGLGGDAPAADRPIRTDVTQDAERRVNRGDTLYGIAEGLTGESASVEQTMLALLAANEAAFINGNINLVRAGAILRVPEASAAQRVTRTQAAAEVTKQARLWQEYRDSRRGAGGTRLAGIPADTATGDEALASAGGATGAEEPAGSGRELTSGAQAIIDEAREEVRELERLRIVGDNATSDGVDATAADTEKLAGIEQRLQLAREQLASSRQEAGDLDDQASALRSTTDNFDALIALRQNDIAALEAQLSEARERAEQETAEGADSAADAALDATADAASDATSDIGELAANTTDSATDALDEAGGAARAASEAAGDVAEDLTDSAAQAGASAERATRNALTDAGQAMDSVELVGEEADSVTADQDGEAAQDGDTDSAIVDGGPTDEAAAPWYQTLLGDPTRLAIAGVGGLALFGALGTLLWRRRRDDEVDAWLDAEEQVEFVDGDAAAASAAGPAPESGPGAVTAVVGGAGAAAAAAGAMAADPGHDRTVVLADDPALQTSDQTASELGGLSEPALDKDDTISEVDVYLAYGLHGQAEELLTRAIDRDPNNPVYARKLLDTYHAQGNSEGFEGAAVAWQARFGGTEHPEWPAIAAMGRELRPDSPMFGGHANAAGMAAAAAAAGGAGLAATAGLASAAGERLTGGNQASDGQPRDHASIDIGTAAADQTDFGAGALSDVGADPDAVNFEDDLAISLDDADESDLLDQSLDPAFAFDVGDLEATGDFSAIADEIARESGDNAIEFDAPATPDLNSGSRPSAPDAASAMAGIDAPELSAAPAAAAAAAGAAAASAVGVARGMDAPKIGEGGANLANDLTLDLDQLSEELELDGTEMLEMPDLTADNDLLVDSGELSADADEVDTMMDLAKAYIDMGDRDSASSTLDEIVKSGNPDQVNEAETLLRKIS